MKRMLVIGGMVLAAVLFLTWVSRPRGARTQQEFDARVLAHVGGRGERRLSRQTFLRMGGLAVDFDRYDADHDGALDAAEFARAVDEKDPLDGRTDHAPPP